MTTRKIFTIIVMILLIFMFANMFIPLLGNEYISYSLWSYLESLGDETLRIIIIIEIVAAVAVCALQLFGVLKDAKFAYFTIGYYLTFFLDLLFTMMNNDTMELAQIGFWLGLISSVAALVLLIIGSFVSNEKKRKVYYNQGNIIGYDPKTGAPQYEQPAGVDPLTGMPIYK